jgi:group I intron endonuclease
MEEKIYCIYKHTTPSGKAYIGLTKNFKERCYQHKHKRGYNACPALSAAIDKYGWDNIKHEILISNLTLDQANRYEEFYIKEYDTLFPNGYNIREGGYQYKITEETKAKISKTLTGRKTDPEVVAKMTEYKRLPEQRKLAAEKQTGKKQSEETKLKKSIALKGKKHSEETRVRMSEAQKGKVVTQDTIDKQVFNQNKIRFIKENEIYIENKISEMGDDLIIVGKELQNLLGHKSMEPIKKRILDGKYPNSYRNEFKYNPRFMIPITDVKKYHSDMVVYYGI